MTTDAETLEQIVEACLARAEARLTTMVNERTTNVISATTAIVVGLQDEQRVMTEALESLSAHTTASLSALTADIAQRRRFLDERIALNETRLATLADLLPGGAEALGVPPLRQVLAEIQADAAATRSAVAQIQARPAAPRWVGVLFALSALAHAAQFLLLGTLLWRLP